MNVGCRWIFNFCLRIRADTSARYCRRHRPLFIWFILARAMQKTRSTQIQFVWVHCEITLKCFSLKIQNFVSFKYFNLIFFAPNSGASIHKILTSFVAYSWRPCIYDAASPTLTLFILTASWLFVRRCFIPPCFTSGICLVKSFVMKFIWLFFSFEFDTNKNHEICNKSKIMADRDRKWMYLLQWNGTKKKLCGENNETSCGGVIAYVVKSGKNASLPVDIAQTTIARHNK